jgi:predicted exporter
VVRLKGLTQPAALQQRLAGLEGEVDYVDLKQATGQMLDGFRQAALTHLGWGALLIILLIGLAGRSLRRLVQVVLPLSAALALTLALQHALGERLSLFHLTSLLLVAGIGIDYGLFFSRRDSASERGRTLHALSVCAISTVTVFAILALSQLPVLHAIGSTVFIGVSAAYLLARFAGSGSTIGGAQRDDDDV